MNYLSISVIQIIILWYFINVLLLYECDIKINNVLQLNGAVYISNNKLHTIFIFRTKNTDTKYWESLKLKYQ